jgi:hypothetical protein
MTMKKHLTPKRPELKAGCRVVKKGKAGEILYRHKRRPNRAYVAWDGEGPGEVVNVFQIEKETTDG